MAKKATQLLREAVFVARRDPAAALGLVGQAGDWAASRRQVNLIRQAAQLWDALGGAPAIAERWRQLASDIQAERAAWRTRRWP
jgi:hypothetical protein